MISTVIKKDRSALIRLQKRMKPEKRLLAFLNLSRLLCKLNSRAPAKTLKKVVHKNENQRPR